MGIGVKVRKEKGEANVLGDVRPGPDPRIDLVLKVANHYPCTVSLFRGKGKMDFFWIHTSYVQLTVGV